MSLQKSELVIQLIVLLFISVGHASVDFAAGLDLMMAGPQISCTNNPRPVKSLKKYALPSSYREHGANCTKFVASNGELGSHGKIIKERINAINGSKYFSSSIGGMSKACPNWAKLSKTDKEYFWVWFFAALAWKEATCREGEINRNATHGSAVGYFQLNEKKSARVWRDGSSGSSCGATEVKTASNNIKCALDIFNEQLKGANGVYEGNGSLAGKGANSYWQDLRQSKGHKVIEMVSSFPGCK